MTFSSVDYARGRGVVTGDSRDRTMASEVKTQAHRAPTEARINYIVGLMTDLEFESGKTVKMLAKKWKVGEQRVRELTAEASKRVRAVVMSRDDIADRVNLTLERILKDAIDDNNSRAFTDERVLVQNRKLIVDAAVAWANMTGASAPKRQEISGKDGGPITTHGPTIYVPKESDD